VRHGFSGNLAQVRPSEVPCTSSEITGWILPSVDVKGHAMTIAELRQTIHEQREHAITAHLVYIEERVRRPDSSRDNKILHAQCKQRNRVDRLIDPRAGIHSSKWNSIYPCNRPISGYRYLPGHRS